MLFEDALPNDFDVVVKDGVRFGQIFVGRKKKARNS